jgi:hypothetical protein
VQSGNYPYALAAHNVPAPTEGQWYLLEAHYTHAVTGKTMVLTVNGVEVASLSQNTVNANNIALVRFGLGYYAGHSVGSVYVDDIVLEK